MTEAAKGLHAVLREWASDYDEGPLYLEASLMIEAAEALEDQERLIETLTEALETTLGKWVDLVDSGDAGFWDAETEPHVIAARSALASAQRAKE